MAKAAFWKKDWFLGFLLTVLMLLAGNVLLPILFEFGEVHVLLDRQVSPFVAALRACLPEAV